MGQSAGKPTHFPHAYACWKHNTVNCVVVDDTRGRSVHCLTAQRLRPKRQRNSNEMTTNAMHPLAPDLARKAPKGK
jgi:hypothetical protein